MRPMSREERERVDRLRNIQAEILGVSRKELERNLASMHRRTERVGTTASIGDLLETQMFAQLTGIRAVADRKCTRCGIEQEADEAGEMKPVRLRLDPIKGGPPVGRGWVCTGRHGKDEHGKLVRIDCYSVLEEEEARYHGAQLRKRQAELDEQREAKKAEQKNRKKGNKQQRLELVAPPEED